MNLILKITSLCNFRCTFCSSTNISENDHTRLPLSYVEDFIKRFPETNTIIVNGGDPMVVPIKYYYDMIEMLDRLNSPATISFTTNLYPFYIAPDKWTPLFKHPRLGVATSFQYGGRLKHDYTEYTEEEFWKVSNLFLERIGYRPDFISVLTDETKDSWYKTVQLAKKMNVVCKINYANASGIQGKPFSVADAYEIYLKIFDLGLEDYEYNTKQFINTLYTDNTTCPLARECDTGIRCLQPDGDYYSCGAMADDKAYPIDFQKEVKEGQFFTPLSNELELVSMHEECFSCTAFNICNGCRKSIKDTKRFNLVESHCRKMKSLINRFEDVKKGIRHPESVAIPDFKQKKIINIKKA